MNSERVTPNSIDLRLKVNPKNNYCELGRGLSMKQTRIYRNIYNSGIDGITADELSKIIYIDGNSPKNGAGAIQVQISFIKQKLGENEIISKQISGASKKTCLQFVKYISRRALIDHMVEENLKKSAFVSDMSDIT